MLQALLFKDILDNYLEEICWKAGFQDTGKWI